MSIGNMAVSGLPIAFFLSKPKHPIFKYSAVWNDPLPLSRKNQKTSNGVFIRYGDYFHAAQTFLEKNRFKALLYAVSSRLKQTVICEKIDQININLEKHGEFYHPARVEVVCGDQRVLLVLNVAISDAGRKGIETEYAVLKKLKSGFSFSYTPAVYGQGSVFVGNFRMDMFLGEWFEDYHEFHVSQDSSGKKRISVWDLPDGFRHLTERQIKTLYRQATGILTAYYNPETYEQIYPWHHAAGDFVVRLDNESIDLKLITARNYASLVQKNEHQSAGHFMEALLVFFLNLSIRMRIDRIDGTGEIVWSEDVVVPEIVSGFFDGLEKKPPVGTMDIPLAEGFEYYFFSLNEKELRELAWDLSNILHPHAPELPIIQKNLKKHIQELKRTIIKRNS